MCVPILESFELFWMCGCSLAEDRVAECQIIYTEKTPKGLIGFYPHQNYPIFPGLATFLHGYIRGIRDILQLCARYLIQAWQTPMYPPSTAHGLKVSIKQLFHKKKIKWNKKRSGILIQDARVLIQPMPALQGWYRHPSNLQRSKIHDDLKPTQ